MRREPILVVADDALLGKALAMFLSDAGYAVIETAGLDALERLARERHCAAAVVDSLPGVDSRAAVALLNRLDVPTILLTHDRRLGEGIDLVACLEKPFPPSRLKAAVAQAVGRQNA